MASARVDLIVQARDARAAARDVRGVASAVDATGAAAGRAQRHTRLADASARAFQGSLRAVATASKFGVAGIAAVGAGAIKMGVGFNATMEQNTVAFKSFLGSTDRARDHLAGLYKMSANTPFEFAELTGASRRLMAFGQSAQESNRWLSTIGDTVSGIGGGSAEIDRLDGAIGQIQAKGKASTEEMLQIAELGVPAFQILAKETGRSMDQVFKDLSDGAISSNVALKALGKGMNAQFGGASAAQAETFTGRLSTLRDNLRLLAGEASKPLFEWLRTDALPAANAFVVAIGPQAKRAVRGLAAGLSGDLLTPMGGVEGKAQEIGRWLRDGFGAGKTLAEQFGRALTGQLLTPMGGSAGKAQELGRALREFDFGALVRGAKALAGPLEGAFGLIKKVLGLPGAEAAITTLATVGFGFKALNLATGGAAGGALTLAGNLGKGTLAATNLITQLVALKTAKVTLEAAGGVAGGGFVTRLLGPFRALKGRVMAPVGALRAPVATSMATTGTQAGLATTRATAFSMRGFGARVLTPVRAVRTSFVASMATTGTLAGTAAATSSATGMSNRIGPALAARQGAFRGAFRGLGGMAGAAMAAAAVPVIIDQISAGVDAYTAARKRNSSGGSTGIMDLPITKFLLPGLASGGEVHQPGWAVVGERGPELLRMPGGATVFDAQQTARALDGGVPSAAPSMPLPAAPQRSSSPDGGDGYVRLHDGDLRRLADLLAAQLNDQQVILDPRDAGEGVRKVAVRDAISRSSR